MLSLTWKIQPFLLGSIFAMAISILVKANAETESADLEVTAGLKDSMTLTCDTALDFGVVAVDFNSFDGGTVVLGTDGSIGNVSSGLTPEQNSVSNGVCSLSGSAASEGSQVEVSYTSQPLTGDDGAFEAISAPIDDGSGEGTGASLTVGSFVESDDQVGASGNATIKIGATLLIPAGINADSLGGYSGTVAVTVDDEPTG